MAEIELNFQRYVRARRDAEEARLREGAAYAYGGDLKVLRATEKLRPVTLALEAAVRLWKGVGEERVLGEAVRLSAAQHPTLWRAVERCAATLHLPPPAVYVAAQPAAPAALTLGTNTAPSIILGRAACEMLGEVELVHLLGRECGHVHNHHTEHLTALHFLAEDGGRLVKWASQPAILLLRSWARRADVTADRAGLLCTRDLETSIAAILVVALGSRQRYAETHVGEYLEGLCASNEGLARLGGLLAEQPLLPQRLAALRLFSQTAYFRGSQGLEGGLTMRACDAQVQELL